LGESAGLLEALEIVRKAAPTMLPILIDGESGTGKELFAKVIHANSSRADQPFVSINCGAIPENLIESELFGHKKGAFTGASSDRKGRFEAANGGTIFLDEVGELPMPGQVKLLRVLQASEIQRVGSDEVTAVDTRVVAATNRDLEKMAEEGTFREDLFYRLGVIHASLPPLRERRDEIPLLCDYFFAEAAEQLQRPPVKLSEKLHAFLQGYAYPGNVRELRNLVYRLSCLADEVADLPHLPRSIRGASLAPMQSAEPFTGSLAEVKRMASDAAEKQFLENGLREVQGRVVDLAKKLDLNRSHLQTLLKKHGIQSKSFKVAK
jgi:transcriptional regulator with PAS, ATPase and Fis domain